jgi:signal transduction histidine kinase
MKSVAENMLQGIPYTFTGPQEKIAEKVDLDTKRNLYMMYKEILNNVVRHASASEVSIAVTWDRGRLTLLVRDNGKGFDPATVHSGNGLDNLRARSKHIGGQLEILSTLSGGTTVRLAVEIT